MLTTLLFLLLGFTILLVGAEMMVRGSSTFALKLGVTPIVIGLTVVAFGTSAPELAVSVESALAGRSSIALGNVIGSNIANIGLILGLMTLISPVDIDLQLVKRQIPLVIGASVFLWLLLVDQEVGFSDGLFLFAGLFGFLMYSYRVARRDERACELIESNPVVAAPTRSSAFYLALVVIGVGLLVYGSALFVESAANLARELGISEAAIGLSLVAIGTSIPEMATSMMAAFKKEPGIAVGNIIGSNLFNILGILGITALVTPVSAAEFGVVDLGIMVAYAVILLPFAWTQLRISRLEGMTLLAGYIAYLVYTFLFR